MSLDGILKLIHVLSAFWFVAGMVGRTVTLAQAGRATSVSTIAALLPLAGRFEFAMIRPGSLVLLIGGVITAWAAGWPVLGFLQGGTSNWVLASLLLYLSIIPLILFVFIPRGRVFEAALAEAQAAGTVTPRLAAAFGDRAVTTGHLYEGAVVVVIILLMVLKPF